MLPPVDDTEQIHFTDFEAIDNALDHCRVVASAIEVDRRSWKWLILVVHDLAQCCMVAQLRTNSPSTNPILSEDTRNRLRKAAEKGERLSVSKWRQERFTVLTQKCTELTPVAARMTSEHKDLLDRLHDIRCELAHLSLNKVILMVSSTRSMLVGSLSPLKLIIQHMDPEWEDLDDDLRESMLRRVCDLKRIIAEAPSA